MAAAVLLTYLDPVLRDQLGGFIHEDGCRWVKMKIGTDPARDPHWMKVAKEAIVTLRFSLMPMVPSLRAKRS